MGCASSAPLTGEGPLGEIKNVANNMVESGEHALHDMGESVGKTLHEAMDHVNESVKAAGHELHDAAANMTGKAANAINSITTEAKKDIDDFLGAPTGKMNGDDPKAHELAKMASSKEAEEMANAVDEIMGSTPASPETDPTEMFRPTPVPSFEKPPTPAIEEPKVDEKIANATIDELANDLMGESMIENVMAKNNPESGAEDMPLENGGTENEENGGNTNGIVIPQIDIQPTKWEALADVIVELPPRMSIDLGTGQLYIVEDDAPKTKFRSKTPILKEASNENQALS